MKGKVVHFEVPAKDLKRAKAFYSEVFGWQLTDVPNYVMVATGPVDKDGRPAELGMINGGMMKRAKPVESPVITIQVDEIDSALKAVESHGGKTVVKKSSLGEMGFYGYFKDTEGNVMGLFQAAGRA